MKLATKSCSLNSDMNAGRIQEIIKSNIRAPKEKWELPITTSHEYGWDQEMHQISKDWYRPRGSTGLTQYVQAYILSQGASPFAKKPNKPLGSND